MLSVVNHMLLCTKCPKKGMEVTILADNEQVDKDEEMV